MLFRSQVAGPNLHITGFELFYIPDIPVTARVVLQGRYPATTGPVTVVKVWTTDARGNPAPGTASSEIRPRGFQLSPFSGYTQRPGDPDGDGVYEDLNGNGRGDFDDVIVLFNGMETIQQDGTVRFFDFNGNNRMDFDDIIQLFDKI